MKFLSKRSDSPILLQNLTYQENRPANNKDLKEKLLKEQHDFCAYTEKYIEELDSVEVEHFNSVLKYRDDYYNYYAVIRVPNLYKKDEAYKGAEFFQTLFFQNINQFNIRIRYIDGVYEEINEGDTEAHDLIDFLGFNHPTLDTHRTRHIRRLKNLFQAANSSLEEQLNHFRQNRQELSFITAIEHELELDLTEFTN